MPKSEFKLQNEVYLVDNRPCKIYLPAIVLEDLGKLYWIRYLDDDDVKLIKESDLTLTKRGRLLYGTKG